MLFLLNLNIKTLFKYIYILIVVSFIAANPISIDTALDFKINTNDINNNGKSDVLCFEGKTIVKKVEIYDVDNREMKSIWSYSLPDNYIGYFVDASLFSLDKINNKIILIASLKNSNKTFFIFNVKNGEIDSHPSNILELPEKYLYLKNPQQLTILNWDNDGEDELAISFSSPFRSILICNLINQKIEVIDNLAQNFLSSTYSPILMGAGDLNGDNKDDIIIVDNGIKANARIYLNGMNKNGLRILGLKDVGQLSFLSKKSVDLDGLHGEELFFASKKFGLHYIFVESIGMVNQAVTVKTELLIETINKIYIAETSSNNQIVTIDPIGALGRYEIVNEDGDLAVGVFENKTINFSITRPNAISSIYFPEQKQLLVSAYNDLHSEIYFYKHRSFIEPAIDYSLQRVDNRMPDIVINVNDSSKIQLPWIDSLFFYEFKSNSLLPGMGFNATEKSVVWSPNINQLGFNEIFFDISFKNAGNFDLINADTLTHVVLNQELITKKDSILIYVNDSPNLQENLLLFDVVGGDDFIKNFKSIDRNVDSKQTFYFLNDDLEGIVVDDSGSVSWKIPEKFIGTKEFILCADDGINKDSVKITFNIHPKIDFVLQDSIYVGRVGEIVSFQFSPDTLYSFNSYEYFLPDAPKNMHIDKNGSFSWEPNPSQIDLNKFTVLIGDGTAESSQIVSVYVNSKPVISSAPPDILYVSKDDNFNFRFDSFDANTDALLEWSLVNGPKGMVVEANGASSWVAEGLDFIDYTISLSDGYDVAKYNGNIYINSLPKITSIPVDKINLGDTLRYKIITEDLNKLLYNNKLEKNIISYSIISGPSNCFFENNFLVWVPGDDYIGNNNFNFSVSDGLEKDFQQFNVFVNDIPKIINLDTLFLEANKLFSHKILINDLNKNDNIDIDLINNKLGVVLKQDSLIWSPDTSQIGNHVLNLRVNDGRIDFENNFDMFFNVFSKPLFLNVPSKEAYVGIEYTYSPKVDFFNNKRTTIELVESPSSSMRFIDNKIIWSPTIEDAKKDIHKIILKAETIKNRETIMEFFIKVYENPKISN